MIRNDQQNELILKSFSLTDEIKEGVIGMVYNKFHWYIPLTYLSKIIRRVRNAPINHCFTIFKINEEWHITEAVETGIENTLLSKKVEKWKKRGDIVLLKYPDKVDRKDLLFMIEKYKNHRYGFETLVKFLWATLFRQPLRSKAAREHKHFVCSQWCALLDGRDEAYRYSNKEIYDLPYKTMRLKF